MMNTRPDEIHTCMQQIACLPALGKPGFQTLNTKQLNMNLNTQPLHSNFSSRKPTHKPEHACVVDSGWRTPRLDGCQ